MFQIDPLGFINLIPQSLKQKARDTLVDFVAEQARKYAGEELATRLKKLRSDAAFNKTFEEALQRAARRFFDEYRLENEDLVAAIAADDGFFRDEKIQQALLAILKRPGAYLVEEQETLQQSFDSVLPQRINRERVDRAVIYLLKCLAEELWHLPELQPIYSLQFQRITAESTREQVAIQKAQLQALTGLNAGLREALLQLTDAIVEKKTLPAGDILALPAPSRPKVYHNLPQPDYGHFVGREKELAQVANILRPYPHSQHSLVTIDGIGGIGKSALALEVAHRYLRNFNRIPPEERFEAIIWTSAKQSILTAEGIVPRRQVLRTLNDIYSAIAVALQRDDITRTRSEEQAEVVGNTLTRQRTLIIVDNLETVDDEAVMAFLRELPAPTKAIVTTRHRIDVAYPVRLVGMPWEDAQVLIANECEKKGVVLTDDDVHRLYDRTGGVPLAIVWSIAQMGVGYGVETALMRLGQTTGNIARFCFEEALERIRGKSAYKLLLALCLFATDASREALGDVADLPELDRDDGLVELEKLSLINKRSDRFQMLPLTLVYSRAELAKDVGLESLLRNRWGKFLSNLLDTQTRPTNKFETWQRVKLEIDNLLNAMDWFWGKDELETLITFAERMNYFLWRTDNWSTWSRYLELGLKATILCEKSLEQAKFLRMLATMRNYQDDLDEAENWIRKSIRICNSNKYKDELISAMHRLGSIQFDRGDYEQARRTLNDAMVIAGEIKNANKIVLIERKLADLDLAEEKYESAEFRLKRAQEFHEQHESFSEGAWPYTYRLLGQVYLNKQDYQLAGQYFQKSLVAAQEISSLHHIAEAKQYLAELELALGHIDLAEKLAQEAIEIFTRLNMKRQFRKTETLIARIKTTVF